MTDTPPLDLDSWEAEANEILLEFFAPAETEGSVHHRILALISELRQTKIKLNQEAVESDMRAEQRNGLSRENILLRERLASAEDILKNYANLPNDGRPTAIGTAQSTQGIPLGFFPWEARAYFAKWEKE